MSGVKGPDLTNLTIFETFFDHTPCGIIVTDMACLVVNANHKATQTLNATMRSGVRFLSLFDERSQEKITRFIKDFNRTTSTSLDAKHHDANDERWFELSANVIKEMSYIIWSINDISSRKLKEKELEELAYYDGLTGLYTRHYFFQLAEILVGQLNKDMKQISILMLDLDDFKNINDSHGHCAGDDVLQAFGTLVSSKLRKSDVFGRIGGEEFAIVLPNTGQDEAVLTATRICHSVEEYFTEHHVTVSIGLVTLRTPNYTFKQALGCADDALYRVKKSGKNGIGSASTDDLKKHQKTK